MKKSDMQCFLLDLTTELKLMIIDELLWYKAPTYNPYSIKSYDVAPYFNKFSDEESEKRFDRDTRIHRNFINWSCTSSFFRNLLALYIFKNVKLVNSQKSGSSLTAIVKSTHNTHVKELHFVGFAHKNPFSVADTFSDTEIVFPDRVPAILCDL